MIRLSVRFVTITGSINTANGVLYAGFRAAAAASTRVLEYYSSKKVTVNSV